MAIPWKRTWLPMAVLVFAACADAAHDGTATGPSGPRRLESATVWDLAELEAEFGGRYSLDTTQAGQSAPYQTPPDAAGADAGTICRDHLKPIDLWWNGGYGIATIHLEPPLLLAGYRRGTYTSPRGLVFRNAVYETLQPAEGTDPAGNVWRFQGRFNARCWGGEFEAGPIAFRAQLVISQTPVDRPVLVRRGDCGISSSEASIYDPAYDPYAEAPAQPEEGSCGDGGGGGDGDGDRDSGPDGDEEIPAEGEPGDGSSRSMCPDDAPFYWDIDCIDLFIEGIGWVEYWCGAVMVCG